MIRRPPRSTLDRSSAASDVYKRQAPGHETTYKFLFMAKGGGSANKSYLYQETKAVLSPDRLMSFLDEKLRSLSLIHISEPTRPY